MCVIIPKLNCLAPKSLSVEIQSVLTKLSRVRHIYTFIVPQNFFGKNNSQNKGLDVSAVPSCTGAIRYRNIIVMNYIAVLRFYML